jgi:hypothetical protein
MPAFQASHMINSLVSLCMTYAKVQLTEFGKKNGCSQKWKCWSEPYKWARDYSQHDLQLGASRTSELVTTASTTCNLEWTVKVSSWLQPARFATRSEPYKWARDYSQHDLQLEASRTSELVTTASTTCNSERTVQVSSWLQPARLATRSEPYKWARDYSQQGLQLRTVTIVCELRRLHNRWTEKSPQIAWRQ